MSGANLTVPADAIKVHDGIDGTTAIIGELPSVRQEIIFIDTEDEVLIHSTVGGSVILGTSGGEVEVEGVFISAAVLKAAYTALVARKGVNGGSDDQANARN